MNRINITKLGSFHGNLPESKLWCLLSGTSHGNLPLFDPKTSEKKTIGAVSLILISLW